MRQRRRKFLGMFGSVGFLIVYSLIAMAIGGKYAVGSSFELVYFIAAGLAWLPMVMLIVRWMSRPDLQ